jgi:hypothetical protein
VATERGDPEAGRFTCPLTPFVATSRVVLGTLWYVVPGTVISVAVLVLLLTPPVRRALGR